MNDVPNERKHSNAPVLYLGMAEEVDALVIRVVVNSCRRKLQGVIELKNWVGLCRNRLKLSTGRWEGLLIGGEGIVGEQGG